MLTDPSQEPTSDAPEGEGGDAQSVFDELQRRQKAGETVDLDDVCEENPDLANALRALHSMALEDGALEDGALEDGALEDAGDESDSHESETRTGSMAGSIAGAVEALRAAEDEPSTRGNETGLSLGDEIGNYRVVDVLGSGGFAVVYKAEQTEPVCRTVALKAIKTGLDTKQILARFEAERQALAVMSHRGIAKVYDAGETERGRSFFVMELVDGVPIQEHCDARSLDTTARLEVFLDVCDAIQHAHQKGIIHRDLKPANVLVTVEGDQAVPKIIDFGIAKALSDELTEATLQTEVGQIIGTPAYMSPEQSSGEPHEVDTRTDIYALGVLLYELLTGSRPFDFTSTGGAMRIAEIQRVIREVDPQLPSARVRQDTVHGEKRARSRDTTTTGLRRRLRGDLDWIVMKALAKDPNHRYATASELAEDVRRFLRDEPVLAGPPSVSYRVRKILRRHRRAVLAVSLILVSVALAAWLTSMADERRAQRERLAESRLLLDQGRAGLASIVTLRRDIDAIRGDFGELTTVRARLGNWRPVWQRGEELAIRERQLALERRFAEESAAAFLALSSALDVAPPESEVFREASLTLDALSSDLESSRSSQSIAEFLFREHDVDNRNVRGTLKITSDPPGAEVFCFRHVERDARLIPVPAHPDRPLTADAVENARFLRVAKIWLPKHVRATGGPRTGDRFVRVGDRTIRSRTDLAGALRGISGDEKIALHVDRAGDPIELEWTPYPSKSYPDGMLRRRSGDAGRKADTKIPLGIGELTDIRRQLGFTFEGYPLDLSAASKIGETGTTLTLPIAAGSFLLVFRKPGYALTRLPIVGPQSQDVIGVLKKTDAIPRGFVFIPPGKSSLGGDDRLFLQNVPYGDHESDGFFLSEFEETQGEYLEFVRERADSEGLCILESDRAKRESGKIAIQILPGLGRTKSAENERPRSMVRVKTPESEEGEWQLNERLPPTTPLFGVSFAALIEYAHWRSKRDPNWNYRLPTDYEWERAARGADRRAFVWGNYMIWSFCRSAEGVHPKLRSIVTLRGTRPFDESVFGVRDMAGSVTEFIDGVTRHGRGHRSVRGGCNYTVDEFRFRTDARYGVPSHTELTRSGVRLVAEPVKK